MSLRGKQEERLLKPKGEGASEEDKIHCTIQLPEDLSGLGRGRYNCSSFSSTSYLKQPETIYSKQGQGPPYTKQLKKENQVSLRTMIILSSCLITGECLLNNFRCLSCFCFCFQRQGSAMLQNMFLF